MSDPARTVHIVDDDPDIAQLLELLLGDLGFQVSSTGDAASAVAQALANPPDVLVVDVELPGLSGNTAVFRLRAQGYTGHIVTLSATPTEEARAAAAAGTALRDACPYPFASDAGLHFKAVFLHAGGKA